MKEVLQFAWRNIWRNKRRTLITLSSVFFAVFLAIVMRGFHLGMWHSLLENVLHSYTGYLQIHRSGYHNGKTLDFTFRYTDSLQQAIGQNPNVRAAIPRLETFALASYGEKTKGVMVAGIQPAAENTFTRLNRRLVDGRLLNPADSGALVSQRLARFLGLNVGDTLVLLGQGYHSMSAAGLFPVRGILRLPSPEWDNKMVYLSLPMAQYFLSADSLLTTLVVDLRCTHRLETTSAKLMQSLKNGNYEVLTWKQSLEELYQQYEIDNISGIIIIGLLYLIIGFGIFGTVQMMTSERRHEFAVMIAVGMKPRRIIGLVSLEMFFISLLGLLAGMAASLPVVYGFSIHPIKVTGELTESFAQYGMEPFMGTLWQAKYILNQGLVIFGITLVAIAYPLLSLYNFKLARALKE